MVEALAFAELHDQMHMSSAVDDLVQADYVLVINHRQDVDLSVERVRRLLVLQILLLIDLQCHCVTSPLVSSPGDGGERTLSYLQRDLEVGDFENLWRIILFRFSRFCRLFAFELPLFNISQEVFLFNLGAHRLRPHARLAAAPRLLLIPHLSIFQCITRLICKRLRQGRSLPGRALLPACAPAGQDSLTPQMRSRRLMLLHRHQG